MQPEDCTQDVLVVVAIPSCRLQLGLLASPELAAPEPLVDAAAAPSLQLQLHYSTSPAPMASAPVTLEGDLTLLCNLEAMFKHRKGPDVIDRLINSSLELRLCNSTSKAVLATAVLDLLPFGLGSSRVEDEALPWQPAATDEPVKVGSSVQVSTASSGCIAAVRNRRNTGCPAQAGCSSTAPITHLNHMCVTCTLPAAGAARLHSSNLCGAEAPATPSSACGSTLRKTLRQRNRCCCSSRSGGGCSSGRASCCSSSTPSSTGALCPTDS